MMKLAAYSRSQNIAQPPAAASSSIRLVAQAARPTQPNPRLGSATKAAKQQASRSKSAYPGNLTSTHITHY